MTCVINEDSINFENFILITDEHGNYIFDDGNGIYCQRKQDNQVMIIPKNIVEKKFGINLSTSDNLDRENEEATSKASSSETTRTWTRGEILTLIELYKINKENFKSSTIKNDRVWQQISENIVTHSAEQCKNKFKYLKQRYTEKKDNMSSRGSGDKAFKFEFFNEFDEIFCNEANINPKYLASSSKGIQNFSSDEVETIGDCNTKKRKRSVLEKQLEKYDRHIQQREIQREKRHADIIDRQDRALNAFEKIASAFEKMTK